MSKRSRRKNKVKKGRDRAFSRTKEDSDFEDLVPHPRFGTKPIPSGLTVRESVIREDYWRYGEAVIFPETAIRADIERQRHGYVPRAYYVDMLKCCRKCGRRFLFFAKEQQYWYEELGFWVHADCVLCPECRKSHQQVRRRFQRYSKLAALKKWSNDELKELASDAVFLWQHGILRKEHVLRRYRNLAMKRCPTAKASYDIDILVRNLPAKQ